MSAERGSEKVSGGADKSAQLLALLESIERGEVTLTSEEEPRAIFAGNVEYLASTGHRIVVFNDCNDWDYIDSIYAPDGALLWDFPDDGQRPYDQVSDYRPSRRVSWERYGIPGYLDQRPDRWRGWQPRELLRSEATPKDHTPSSHA